VHGLVRADVQVGRARIGKLRIDELEIGRLTIRDKAGE